MNPEDPGSMHGDAQRELGRRYAHAIHSNLKHFHGIFEGFDSRGSGRRIPFQMLLLATAPVIGAS